jgi:hypothetical protein
VKKSYRTIMLAVFVSFQSINAFATTLLPLDITALYQQAELILLVESVSSSAEKEADTGLVVTYSTFNVLDALKGEVSGTYTVKQIGGVLADDAGGLRIPGVPSFVSGQKYILFMPPVSNMGFCSPVGLGQGMFGLSIIDNTEMVSNGRDFGELTKSIARESMPAGVNDALQSLPERTTPANQQRRTQMPLTDFIELIRTIK